MVKNTKGVAGIINVDKFPTCSIYHMTFTKRFSETIFPDTTEMKVNYLMSCKDGSLYKKDKKN